MRKLQNRYILFGSEYSNYAADARSIERFRLPESVIFKKNDNEIETQSLAFPNPSSGLIQISNMIEEGSKITISNLSGKVVYEQLLRKSNKIDISSNIPGVYMLEIEQKGSKETYQQRIVIIE